MGESVATLSKGTPSYWRLVHLADNRDVLLMLLGTLGSLINGFAVPVMYLIQSHLFNKLGKEYNNQAADASKQAILCVYLALVSMFGAYLEMSCWIYTGHRQARRLRELYSNAVLRQDSAFFDCKCSPAEVVNNISTDVFHVQEAVGEKLGSLLEHIFLFVASFLVSLLLTWRMTLLILPFMLFLLLPGFWYSKALSSYARQRRNSYSSAGRIAEQAISAIRVVYSFVAEKRTLELYQAALEQNAKLDRMQGLSKGVALGLHGLRYGVWALMIWLGGNLVASKHANGVQVLIAGSAFVTGSMALGSAIQNLKEVCDGHTSLNKIFKVVDAKPSIDFASLDGKQLPSVQGQLEFVNVLFVYPSRPGVVVLDDFNLRIESGKMTAIVGGSGSGKSTIIALVERFYDPLSGKVYLDGEDLKSLQLKWFRQQFGLINQEPALFSFSIKENILLGKEESTMDEIVAAAKLADAHSFIMQLPKGYDTQVGVRGTRLSGGQRQRIAIARAVIRNPKILLLDEATSALDNESESIVQKAIQEVCIGRTSVLVAHKLQSIKKADMIAVIGNGKVVEFGTPEELLSKNGTYSEMHRLENKETNQSGDSNSLEFFEPDKARYNRKMDLQAADNLGKSQEHQSLVTATATKKPSFLRLLRMNPPEWKHCGVGLVGAMCIGFLHPAFVSVGANFVSSFYTPDRKDNGRKIKFDAAIFGALSLLALISNIAQHYSFGVMGAALTKRVREKMLAQILRFEVAWFDEERNSSGALCSRLATNAMMVRTLVGDSLSVLVQTGSTICASIVLSLIVSWKLAVVIISIQPLVLLCFYSRVSNLRRFAKKAAGAQNEVSQLVHESTMQHQTVAAFSSQEKLACMVKDRMKPLGRKAVFLSQSAGISSGIALFVLLSSYGLCIWYGGRLIAEEKCSFRSFLVIFYLLVGTGRMLADMLALTPDISQGMVVAESVLEILERKPKVGEDQFHEDRAIVPGKVEFENVYFAYPKRPDIQVLKNFSLTIEAAQTVAVVGRSGSGKSTVISLIERFYEPQGGTIKLDGKDIRRMGLKSLRQQVALVNQEPTLFAMNIRDNIAYGKDDATDAEIIQAATAANAHTFISSLPDGYSTFVGEMGDQLSGGQKQRIAIARAVLKSPKILLLDEATSALDTMSERVVQQALDTIMVGRTSIVVAHRLSTIQHAGKIAMLQKGQIVEQGTYKELMALNGAFSSLAHAL